MYDSVSFAKYVYAICQKKNLDVGNTKFQKLIYAIYGFILAVKGIPIIGENPKTWPYGPVFPKIYKQFEEISKINADIEIENWERILTKEIKECIEKVLLAYGGESAINLTNWSHMKGSPWYVVIEIKGKPDNSVIPDDLIADYFKTHVIANN
jgi:uncharacterized phage-associated protein